MVLANIFVSFLFRTHIGGCHYLHGGAAKGRVLEKERIQRRGREGGGEEGRGGAGRPANRPQAGRSAGRLASQPAGPQDGRRRAGRPDQGGGGTPERRSTLRIGHPLYRWSESTGHTYHCAKEALDFGRLAAEISQEQEGLGQSL